MDSLFGVSMTLIMYVLLGALAVSLSVVLYVVVRNRVMFLLGVRNMPRRVARTVLIVVGLMLSTLIISAAFTTGDTVDRSLTNTVFTLLGHVDEVVQLSGEEGGAPNEISSTIPQEANEKLRAAVEAAADSNIDGYLPMLFEQVPIINPESRLSEPSATFVGLDADSLEGFPDIISATTGEALDISSLAADEAFLNKSAADALAAEPGDRVQVFVQLQPHEFTIVDIVEDRFTTGVGSFEMPEGLVTRLDTLQQIFERPGEVSIIAISNRGGVRDGVGLTDDVIDSFTSIIAAEGLTRDGGGIGLTVNDIKRELVEDAELAGNVMATFFLVFGLFSIAAGVLLIIMIFSMLAAERKSELGMARAIGTKRGHLVQMFLSEGMAYNVLAAMVGAGLGILVSFGMMLIMARIFSEFGLNIQPHVTLRSMVVSYSLGVVLTFATVTFASWRVSNLNIVRAIRDIPEPVGQRMGWRWLATGLAALALGGLLIDLGLNGDARYPFDIGLNGNTKFPFALGSSMMFIGTAIVLRFVGLPERAVFTTLSVALLTLWGFLAGDRLEFLFGELEGDVEMFFLSGIVMIAASTFVLVYNMDIVLPVISRFGGLFSGILPAVRTAVAYPMANRFRTGMTLAMISLVIFALTMMSTMNLNFNRLFLTDAARGGWDVIAVENLNNPIVDLAAELEESGSSAPDDFRAVGRVSLGARSSVRQVEDDQTEFDSYPVFGVDAGFVDGGLVPLSTRARGYDSDEAVWQAMKTRDDVAVVDHFSTESGGFFGDESFHISGIDSHAEAFDPVMLEIGEPLSGATRRVEVIGVIGLGASAAFFGIYVPQETFDLVYDEPLFTRHLVSLQDPDESKAVAREIESSLFTFGVQSESLKQLVEDEQQLFRNFFLLMQGFMGLGLFVGIAAVGVIAFRTVVERRQQIGMLRAIGYKRSTVALSFMLESSFVTLLAIGSGVGLAIWLSYFLITSDQFPTAEAGYVIPWLQIAVFSTFAFVASLLMTFIPARQAASVSIAEALRYE